MQQRKARLDELVKTAARKAQDTGRSVLVCVCEKVDRTDPLTVLESVDPALTPDRMFWSDPNGALAFAAVGSAHMFDHDGQDRFTSVDRDFRQFLENAVVDGLPNGVRAAGPRAVGGFAFESDGPHTAKWSGFGSSRLFLPAALIGTAGRESWLTLNTIVDADGECSISTRSLSDLAERLFDSSSTRLSRSAASDELTYSGDSTGFKSLVAHAIAEIAEGKLEKVVLARALNGESEREIDAFAVLRNLKQVHRTAFVFGLWSGDKVFVGASPELLARQERREVLASSLAGTIERGTSDDEDAKKARALMESEKDRAEHAAVRDALYEALLETCDNVVAPSEPVILSLANVHHLHTALSATLRDGKSLLDLVEILHPTPAVGGTPREDALAFIRENEQLDRGWYAAPVGWIGELSGEFAVALRSALIQGSQVTLFAGCGIVADSDPEMEVEESNLKLQAMKSALSASPASESPEPVAATGNSSKGGK